MERFRELLKWILYGVVLVLTFSFQSAYAARIVLLGARLDFLPFFVVCIAFLEGAKPGALMGIAAGILCGTVTNLGVLYTLLYFAAGYAVGYLSETYLRTNFLTVLLFAFLLDMFCVLFRALTAYVLQIRLEPLLLLAEYGGYALLTAAGALPLYPLLKGIRRLSDPIVQRDHHARYRL